VRDHPFTVRPGAFEISTDLRGLARCLGFIHSASWIYFFGKAMCLEYGPCTLQTRMRPYDVEKTASRPICKVNRRTAQSVVWSGTTCEYCGAAFFFLLVRHNPCCSFFASDVAKPSETLESGRGYQPGSSLYFRISCRSLPVLNTILRIDAIACTLSTQYVVKDPTCSHRRAGSTFGLLHESLPPSHPPA
jgi:hypothetical protein